MDLENYQCLPMILINYNGERGTLTVLHRYPIWDGVGEISEKL